MTNLLVIFRSLLEVFITLHSLRQDCSSFRHISQKKVGGHVPPLPMHKGLLWGVPQPLVWAPCPSIDVVSPNCRAPATFGYGLWASCPYIYDDDICWYWNGQDRTSIHGSIYIRPEICCDSFWCLENARTGQEILAAVLLKESRNLLTCGLCFYCFLTLANDTGLVQLRSAQFILSLGISTHYI